MQKKGDGNIKVFCRFRPFNPKELVNNANKIHRVSNKSQLIIKDSRDEQISFMFDNVFDTESTQDEVFEKVGGPVLNNVLDGYHGTIMAYGQTSSGKTHTMQGYDFNDKESRGIMPRMIEKLFTAIEKSPDSIEYKIKISIFQLYMQKVRDLLDITKNDLKLRQSRQQGCYIECLTERYVNDKQQLFKIILYGQKNRSTCSTNMNEHSSRSHLIFLLTLNQFNNMESSSKTSKLFLIDLAGSEKISKTGAEGKVLQQAKKINLSLTNLGKVIKALSQKGVKAHVPYRDSKLTRILKDSLGGNSKTTLIVTCSPHEMHLAQTITTLRFGQNAQKVKNKPLINKQLTVQQLQKVIEKLELQQKDQEQRVKVLEDYISNTLKVQLPKNKRVEAKKIQERAQSQGENDNQLSETVILQVNEEAELRITSLENELQSSQFRLNVEMDKYYQLKKQYNELHDNLTSILKENIHLQEQLEEKQRKSLFNDRVLQENSYLIKLIFGEIMAAIGNQQQKMVNSKISESYWYKKIMIDDMPCSDYWQLEKDQMNRQLQEIMNQTHALEALEDSSKKKEESRIQKDNEKIVELQKKIDLILQEYNSMMALQTSWKAECQLYERKLKNKEQQIENLEKNVIQLQENLDEISRYDDQFDDKITVRSNKIIKPLKGGINFHW